jgi:hypothetical protein
MFVNGPVFKILGQPIFMKLIDNDIKTKNLDETICPDS